MSPKKPPRDRDVFVRKEGTPAVRLPSEPSAQESWAGDTGTHDALPDDDTPIGMPALEAQAEARLRSRVKETNNTVRDVSRITTTTSTSVDTLRLETKKDVARLEGKIGTVDQKVDKVDGKVDKLGEKIDGHQETMLTMVGAVGELKGAFTEMSKARDQKHQHEIITFGQQVTIDTAEKVAEIKDGGDAAKQKRSFKYKVGATLLKVLGAGAIVAVTAIATHFIERC